MSIQHACCDHSWVTQHTLIATPVSTHHIHDVCWDAHGAALQVCSCAPTCVCDDVPYRSLRLDVARLVQCCQHNLHMAINTIIGCQFSKLALFFRHKLKLLSQALKICMDSVRGATTTDTETCCSLHRDLDTTGACKVMHRQQHRMLESPAVAHPVTRAETSSSLQHSIIPLLLPLQLSQLRSSAPYKQRGRREL